MRTLSRADEFPLHSVVNEPTTEADYRAYESYAKRERYAARDQQQTDVQFDDDSDGDPGHPGERDPGDPAHRGQGKR